MKKAFTLVELLIVIIIIGILATLALPQYQRMVNRARWAECTQLAAAIKTAENLYYAENNVWRTGTGINLASLSYLDLPASAQRRFNFSIKINYMVYGYSTSAGLDDVDSPPANRFSINLTNNSTAYEGTAPGTL